MVAIATRKVGRTPRRRARNIEQLARELVAAHEHFRGRADQFKFLHCDGVLIVQGSVPSFYLKQVLQSALKRLYDVRQIVNQVDVICCRGLSSVSNN